VDRVYRQLTKRSGKHKTRSVDLDNALLISILSGYPDRVARCRLSAKDQIELLLAGGGSAQLGETSVARTEKFIVAVDAEQRQTGMAAGRNNITLVRIASRIDPDWLIELYL